MAGASALLAAVKGKQLEFGGFEFTGGRGYVSANIVRRLSDERMLVIEHAS
jgi:hypothetical protein